VRLCPPTAAGRDAASRQTLKRTFRSTGLNHVRLTFETLEALRGPPGEAGLHESSQRITRRE